MKTSRRRYKNDKVGEERLVGEGKGKQGTG